MNTCEMECFLIDSSREIYESNERNIPLDWKDADDSGAKSDIDEEVKRQVHIDFGKDALHVKIIAMVYLKRSGIRFAPLRDEFDNDYSKGCDNFTNETSIKHRRICLYKVPSVWTSRTVTGETQQEM